jgi:L-alanine-DL-glutamate epimerase-like enolase superfamily enzyme
MRVAVARLTVPWRAPLLSAGDGDRAAPRPLLLLTLTGEDGVSGYGEAAPLERYDGVSVPAVVEALARCEARLASCDGTEPGPLLESCEALAKLPEAVAAIDMALWDLAGRRAGKPVWKLLGGAAAPAVAVNATIGAERPSQAAAEAAAATAAGFGCVKVKVGTRGDAQRLAAVRAAIGAPPLIRIDANGAWNPVSAVDTLASLRVHGLELCEEPVHGLDLLGAVAAAADVPVAADESTREPGAFSRRVCDAVCLKIGRCGGVSGLVRDATVARAAGYEVYVASTLDGPIGIAAALHACATIAPDRHCGLATLGRFDRPDPMPASDGMMSPPGGAGLGDGLVDWYRLK